MERVHVVYRDRRWAVIRPGATVPDSVHDLRADALRAARRIAAAEGTEVIVYGIDGRPQDPGEETSAI